MSKETDPALFGSEHERNRLDRYWTNPWLTVELFKPSIIVSKIGHDVWECAAGRGDMSQAIAAGGFDVYSSDIDMSEFDYGIGPGHERSFLDEFELPVIGGRPVTAIITNPPYSSPWRGIADDFIEHSLGFFDQGVTFLAMLMRSEFSSGKSKRRRLKFGECEHFMGELTLTTRPRWDYGDPDAPENAAPRHNFSWFLWSRDWKAMHPHPIQIFSYMPKGFKP